MKICEPTGGDESSFSWIYGQSIILSENAHHSRMAENKVKASHRESERNIGDVVFILPNVGGGNF